ncbi:unnamed protein product [Tilletia controversa]|nr:unnamed protein product [Tilletia controversa]
MTLLYYFDLLSRKEGNPKPGKKDRMIYTWRCRCCLKCLDHPVGQTGNLVAHIRSTQLRGTCPSREKPQTPGVDPYVEESGGELKPAPTGVPASKSRASIAATSYHGADTTERLYGSQDINAPLVRRLALINVVENTLPFEFVKSPSNVQLFKAVDARSAFGITLKTKTQQKVLALRPAPILDAQDSAAGANDAIGAADHAPDTDDDLTDDEDEDEDEDIEDDAYGASGYPLSDDGGGPGAADDVLYVVSAKPQTAMSVLERFVHAVRRTKRSQKQFRNCMEQVYRNDPDKKAAPLPPKPKVTRWNSYLEMVEAALSIRDAIDEHCTKNMESGDKDVGSCFLSPEKWKVLESLQQIFTLVNDVIKDMEAKNGTLCKLLDNYASLMTEIDSIRSTLSAASDDEESSETIVLLSSHVCFTLSIDAL